VRHEYREGIRYAIVLGVLAVSCANAGQKDNQAVDRACTVSKCFNKRDIRDFEVINRTTLIVFIGSQRCPFKVELRGTSCDMTFAPTLTFHKGEITRQDDLASQVLNDAGFSTAGQVSDDKICTYDISVGVDGGVFTESRSQAPLGPDGLPMRRLPGTGGTDSEGRPIDRFGNVRSQCQISSVDSLTDDSLMELYVTRGVLPPPPPIGEGEIKVAPQTDAPEALEDNTPSTAKGRHRKRHNETDD
jgi:hypothetical protein